MKASDITRFDITSLERVGIGQLLKEKREAKGWSKYKVYTVAGITPAQLDSIESGDKNYTVDTLLAYCKGAGVLLPALDVSLFKSSD